MKIFKLTALILLVSCSATKKSDEVKQEEAGVQLSDAKEFVNEEVTATNEEPKYNVEEGLATNLENPPVEEAINQTNNEPVVETALAIEKTYTVQKNETLMMVAFKLYGDYSKWRTISEKNQDIIHNGMIREGATIKYDAPSEEFVWNPQGNPHLIKSGDTLGTISNEAYSTTAHWKKIWENNKPLIKDPNKIFTGFTIYTPYLESVAQN